MTCNFIAGVYSNHVFSAKNPTSEQKQKQQAAVKDLSGSGMDVVILASFHVHEDGTIYFNDTAAFSGGQPTGLLNPDLPDLLQQMASSGITILASFGGGGGKIPPPPDAVGYYDFTCIKNLDAQYPTPADNPFYQNLAALFATYPAISGLDNDLETYSGYDQFLDTVNGLTRWLADNGHTATIAPYTDPDFWTNVLNDSKDAQGNPTVSWANLQSASGRLQEFVPAFQGVWPDVPAHLLAGEQIDSGTSPQDVETAFSNMAQQQSGLRGGWLWFYEAFTDDARAFASAIKSGLGCSDPSAAAGTPGQGGSGS